jgi:hypothetical protein
LSFAGRVVAMRRVEAGRRGRSMRAEVEAVKSGGGLFGAFRDMLAQIDMISIPEARVSLQVNILMTLA